MTVRTVDGSSAATTVPSTKTFVFGARCGGLLVVARSLEAGGNPEHRVLCHREVKEGGRGAEGGGATGVRAFPLPALAWEAPRRERRQDDATRRSTLAHLQSIGFSQADAQ